MQKRARKVGRLVRRMPELLPYLTEQDVPCCRGWAEAELIGAALFASIMKDGAIYAANGDIAARRVVNDWRQIKLLQLAYERELGLTPAARATLRATTKGESEFDLVPRWLRVSTLLSPSSPSSRVPPRPRRMNLSPSADSRPFNFASFLMMYCGWDPVATDKGPNGRQREPAKYRKMHS